ncbi:YcdB/YcdC domain-containing protein [Paenibacillus sp. SN-8-1]|uniref:YcdB/YcdC domain-containing protein n=1 Tax=Paenibacillus sp. SN-8-1 TaxID=3435409 RepID=UPI003D9A88C9
MNNKNSSKEQLTQTSREGTYARKNRPLVFAACTLVLLMLSGPTAAWADNTVIISDTKDSRASGSTVSASTSTSVNGTSDKLPNGAKITSAQADKAVKEMFPLLSKVTLSSAEFGNQNSYPVDYDKKWELQYNLQIGNWGTSFSAQVDGVTGEVIYVSLPGRLIQMYTKEGASKVDETSAKKIALDWLSAKVKGLDVQSLKEDNSYNRQSGSLFTAQDYYFNFKVPVNGLYSDFESVQVGVNYNGEVTVYNRSKAYAVYPSPKPAITLESAEQKFKDSFDVELSYIPDRLDSRETTKYFLGYLPVDRSMNSIDAVTGKQTEPQVGSVQSIQKAEDVPSGGSNFTPSKEAIQDGDEALERIKSFIPIPPEFTTEYKQLSRRWNNPNQKVWNISLRDKAANGVPDEGINAEVEASTGQIVSFGYYIYNSPAKEYKPKGKILNSKEAKEKALQIVKKLVPNAASEYKLTSTIDRDSKVSTSTYQYSFKRYIHGIPVMNDSIDLSLSSDGVIRSFSAGTQANAAVFPDGKPVVSQAEAKNNYLNDWKMELKYERLGGINLSDGSLSPVSVKLVYGPVPKSSELGNGYMAFTPIDAITGKSREIYVPYGGVKAKEAADIKGHPLEKSLVEAVQYRVLLPDDNGLVLPNEQITQGEWINMAARAVYPDYGYNYALDDSPIAGVKVDSPYYQGLQVFINNNWLTVDPDPSHTLTLDVKLTRDQLAKYLVEMLQYNKLAQFYNQPTDLGGASDASSITNKGAAAIALKLKLLDLKDGKFAPDALVTRAEAADVLVRLKDLVGRTDNFLNQYYY